MLTRDEILAKSARPVLLVEVPEWGGSVRLTQLSIGKRQKFSADYAQIWNASGVPPLKPDAGPDEKRVHAQVVLRKLDHQRMRVVQYQMVAASILDDQGNPQFAVEELQAMSQESGAVLDRLIGEVHRFNHFHAEAVEDEAKN